MCERGGILAFAAKIDNFSHPHSFFYAAHRHPQQQAYASFCWWKLAHTIIVWIINGAKSYSNENLLNCSQTNREKRERFSLLPGIRSLCTVTNTQKYSEWKSRSVCSRRWGQLLETSCHKTFHAMSVQLTQKGLIFTLSTAWNTKKKININGRAEDDILRSRQK